MYRLLLSLIMLFLTVFFGWWFYIPLSILYAYLSKTPYELLLLGFFLDYLYYFGEGFLSTNRLFIFSAIVVLISVFLSDKLEWKKII
jgi:hypothetical protein